MPDPGDETSHEPDGSASGLLETIEELLLGGPPAYTRVEVAERAGIPLEEASSLWHSLGLPHAEDDEVAFTETDLDALRRTTRLIDEGILDEASRTAMVRTWGRSFARLAEWQTTLLTSVAAASDDPQAKVEQLAGDVVPVVERLQDYVWRRHLLSAAARMLVEPAGADGATVRAVGFVDIVGYTSRSKHLDQVELVELVEHFEDVATSVTTDHGGQLIKTIGDEVLLVADDPVEGASIVLELVEMHQHDDDFPEVRAGAAYGDVVSRLGDVYGPTVNIASRLTSLARPGTVLLDSGLREALGDADPDEERFRLRRIRHRSVKGYHRLEPWRLRRASGTGDD